MRNLTRRRFIVALAALSGTAGSILNPQLFSLSRAWAESGDASDAGVRRISLRMARLIYPHDALGDEVYAGILDQALENVVSGEEFAAQLDAAAAALDKESGGDWSTVDAAAQVEAMRKVETQPFFAAIVNQVRFGLYFSPAYWAHVGYPGPSKDFGGYLHHGAGEIDWLPEETS